MSSRQMMLLFCFLQVSYHLMTFKVEARTAKVLYLYATKHVAKVMFDQRRDVIGCETHRRGDDRYLVDLNSVESQEMSDKDMEALVRTCSILKTQKYLPVSFVPYHHRSKRSWVIAPGTKWCGAGNSADNYEHLGSNKQTDICCRDHDHCDLNIGAWKTAHGITNYAIVTRSGCHCEEAFHSCLKNAAKSEKSASMIGTLYFSLLKLKCIKKVPKKKCVKKFWKFCMKEEVVPGETVYDFVKSNLKWK